MKIRDAFFPRGASAGAVALALTLGAPVFAQDTPAADPVKTGQQVLSV